MSSEKSACSLGFWPLAGVAVATWMASCGAPSHESMTYPESRTVDVVDTLWGTAVADPYRWLEDDRDPEVMDWVSAQAQPAPTSTACPSGRPCGALRSVVQPSARGHPSPHRRKVFLTRNNGLQNQSVIFVQDEEGRGTRLPGSQCLERRWTVTANLSGASPTAVTWWRFETLPAQTGKKCACSTWRRRNHGRGVGVGEILRGLVGRRGVLLQPYPAPKVLPTVRKTPSRRVLPQSRHATVRG